MTIINNHRTRIRNFLPALAFLCLALLLFSYFRAGKAPAPVPAPSDTERLILYTSMQEEVYGPLAREFENRTGVWVSVKTGGSLSELSRISSGAKADWDVMLAPADALESYRDLFAPAASPLSDQAVFPYSSSSISIIYNTKLVQLHPPDGLQNLLDPVWEGRLAFLDPQSTGEGYSCLQTIRQALTVHESVPGDRLSQALSGPHFSDMDELIRAVANGTYYIGVVSEDAALRAAASGYDITIVRPKEETSPILNAMAVLKDSPHQENAKKFLDFLLDETVQEYLSGRFFFHPYQGQETEARP